VIFPPDLIQAIDEDHAATDALLQGDPEPKKKMFSRHDDVSLANPLGPAVMGSQAIERQLDGVASQFSEGEPQHFERIAEYASDDLAYIHEIEHCPGLKSAGAEHSRPFSLRATTIWRREDGGWKIAHRHADPITASRPLESVFAS
jgi:ketosteroid isomerase-like protein